MSTPCSNTNTTEITTCLVEISGALVLFLQQVQLQVGHTMAQAVSCQPPTVEAHIQSQASPRGI